MNSPAKTPWTKAVKVTPLTGKQLRVQREDGSELWLDLSDLIQARDAYWRLLNDRYFQWASIDPLGGICWPEGEDLAPDGLERYTVEEA